MAKKGFYNTETTPAEDLSKKITLKEEPKAAVIEPTPAEAKKEPEMKKPTSEKKKVGRPKTIEVPRRNINIAVPIYLLDKYDEVKKALGGNQTAYIVNLIEKDMNENYQKYKEIAKLQEQMGL